MSSVTLWRFLLPYFSALFSTLVTYVPRAAGNEAALKVVGSGGEEGGGGGGLIERERFLRLAVLVLRFQSIAAQMEEKHVIKTWMMSEERQAHLALQGLEQTPDIPEDVDLPDFAQDDDILHGHAGESIPEDEADQDDVDLLQELREHHNQLFSGCSRRRRDRRTRCNRTQIMVDMFAVQLEKITNAYMDWSLTMADKGLGGDYTQLEGSVEEEKHPVWVVDLFSAYYQDVPIVDADVFIALVFVQNGLMPCSPHEPSVVMTMRVVEVFCVLQICCPWLRMQAFVHRICALHGVAPRPYLGQKFSVAYNIYLSIRAEVDKRVKVTLGQDASNWRLKNACPACATEAAFDHDPEQQQLDEEVLAPRDVNKWGNEGMNVLMRGFEEGAEQDDGAGCDERWENMKQDVTARTYRMYDETGIFLALCRHGFMLVIVDMVQSGELAKYSLAVINHLICVLGEVAVGVVIGCKTGKMVKEHPRLSQLAFDNKFRCLMGSFHGLGHGRLCQVSNLVMYMEGMGLEDWEGCESWFLKLNALVSMTR
ncbi:hypothetical protein DFH08DRAFT_1046440 [Mycena albidolilacea]|uniref:Uncharacterized protein n=1 Tax=Mycena albidolilacea TaxID=1033008 RepID=A0AAD6Z701_9AGAR|nr:hypothetical protein DFH08DRAFT_1046440 [Mycena albidolilacea]